MQYNEPRRNMLAISYGCAITIRYIVIVRYNF